MHWYLLCHCVLGHESHLQRKKVREAAKYYATHAHLDSCVQLIGVVTHIYRGREAPKTLFPSKCPCTFPPKNSNP